MTEPTSAIELHGRRCIFDPTVLRLDGVASAHAGYQPGELISKPVRFRGTKLALNYATPAVGSVRVELQDVSGQPIDGFTLDDSETKLPKSARGKKAAIYRLLPASQSVCDSSSKTDSDPLEAMLRVCERLTCGPNGVT